MRTSTASVLGITLCLCLLLVGTAGATSVSVVQQTDSVLIEVSDEGDPVVGASVTVTGVNEETPLDGEYVTNEDGLVIFNDSAVSELEGVVHLRITVQTGNTYKSTLSTITRGSEVGSEPLGQRISVALHESAESSRGKIEGRLNAGRINETQINELGNSVDKILRRLGEAQFEREVISRDLAAGEISTRDFYRQAVKNAGEIAFLRSSLRVTVEELSGYSEERLLENGVDPEELSRLRTEIEEERVISTDRRITG